ncbi:hypothetical protein [Spirosoma flavum]|uniref:Uncharacterized protein n=1 Tax=Spirosoma flavum TaxID=2048557 RepID=A0ABW6ALM6_9BACT
MEKLQTQLTFFLWNRNILGWIWVVKRMMFALTVGQILDGTTRGAIVFLTLREGLSAITDYAQAKDPIKTTNQSSPPNPTPEEPTEPQTPI